MSAAGARPKATKIYLVDCTWSRNIPKTQHTSCTHTLTLLKYFSSASHNIILSLSYDLISYTLFLLFLHFFIILRFSSLSSSCSIQSRFLLDLCSLLKEIWSYELTFKRLTKMKYRMHKSIDWTTSHLSRCLNHWKQRNCRYTSFHFCLRRKYTYLSLIYDIFKWMLNVKILVNQFRLG